MAAAMEAEERELAALPVQDIRDSRRGCFNVDGGYATGRNAHCCTLPAMASGSNRIIAFKAMAKVTKPKAKKPTIAADSEPTEEEDTLLSSWRAYDAYAQAQSDAKADKDARADSQRPIKEAKKMANAWERTLRSMYRYVFEHVADLRGRVNPASRSSRTTSTTA